MEKKSHPFHELQPFTHHCLTLGLDYKDRWFQSDPKVHESSPETTSNLRSTCTFVDLVPHFREMRDRVMVDMIHNHKENLTELVGSRLTHFSAALGTNECVMEWNDAETAQSAGLFHIRHLSHVWKGFLFPIS